MRSLHPEEDPRMKLFFFHLMPYADLDLGYAKSHDTAWVTLPNSYFDPARGKPTYDRYIGELELADELGFDGICVNEHHQTAYGLMPAPNLIAAALARTTKRAKIAVLGRALPLVANPVNIAEEFAMLDQMSGGRLIAGFVRGIGSNTSRRRSTRPIRTNASMKRMISSCRRGRAKAPSAFMASTISSTM